MDNTDPAGVPASGGRRPRPVPLPVRKPPAEPAGTPSETQSPNEAQRADVVRALRATRRAASTTSGAPVPATRPSGAGDASPPHGLPLSEEGGTSSSGLPRKPILIAAIAGIVLVCGALLLSGLGADRTSPTASPSGRDNSRADSTHFDVAPADGGGKNSAEPAEEKRKGGDTGEVSADVAEKDQEERKGKQNSGTDASGDAGGALSDTSDADTKTSSDKVVADSKDGTVAGRTLTGLQSGKCLSGGSAGALLTIRTCDGAADQRWDFRPDGTARSLGLCMDLVGASKDNGTAIRVAACTGAAAQQFHLNATEDLVAQYAAKCVDVYDRRSADGTRAVLWPCTGAANQTWTRQ